MTLARLLALSSTLGALLLAAPSAHAQNTGFDINRYQPTPVGEWSFMVDHPWYSRTRYFAVGVTLNYAHDPLVYALVNNSGSIAQTSSIIEHQLIGSLDIAGSFLDRVNISASMPLTLLERGQAVGGIAPLEQPSIRDPRVGVMVRLYGQPNSGPFSISIGGSVWIPLRKFEDRLPVTTSDSEVRVLPKLVLGGLSHHVLWSFVGGFLYRPDAVLSPSYGPDGSATGSSVQLGAAIAYADTQRRFVIGPEVLLDTVVTGGRAFGRDSTSLEALLGAHYNIAGQVQLGAAVGMGALREPGTPDVRALFRLAYAPIRKEKPKIVDRDGDGVLDKVDACPDTYGVAAADPAKNGCPRPTDRDSDGVADPDDLCIDVAAGQHPDPTRRGCPLGDKDNDGVFDPDDLCIDVAAGPNPDPARKGCPLGDKDNDGVFDPDDQCIDVAAGPTPDPLRKGCPDRDSDNDGILDSQDQCKDIPQGLVPDPTRLGCPAPDRDGDSVPDATDACPDKPGAPDPNPKKNGCPGLVEIKGGLILIKDRVYFDTNKATIQKRSDLLLGAVAHTIKVTPTLKKIEVGGYADDRGGAQQNQLLTEQRSHSVEVWLIAHGVAAERLTSKGYGSVPINPKLSKAAMFKQRELNRRVEFRIVDPPQPVAAPAPIVPVVAPAPPQKGPVGKGVPGKGVPGKGVPGKGVPGKGIPGKAGPGAAAGKAPPAKGAPAGKAPLAKGAPAGKAQPKGKAPLGPKGVKAAPKAAGTPASPAP